MKKTAPVSEIMSRYIVSVTPNTSVLEIKSLFDSNNFHHLPVVDNGKLMGIISKINVYQVTHCDALFRSKSDQEFNNRLLKSILAEEIMSKHLVVLSPTDTVVEAAALFSKNKYHALPVIDNGKFVGIVTTYDLLEYAYHDVLLPVLM
jgi:CBS domain-containing membrane protein